MTAPLAPEPLPPTGGLLAGVAAADEGDEPDGLVAATPLIVLTTVLGLLTTHHGALLQVLYPALVLGAAAWLVRRAPAGYLVFTLWVWILSPLLRRLVDHQTVYHDGSVLLLAPYFSVIVVLPVIVQHWPRDHRLLRPFAYIAGALLAGTLVGVALAGLLPSIYGALDWSLPFALAAWVLVERDHLDAFLSRLSGLAVVAGLALGAYGIAQFFWLPSWDAEWMQAVRLASIGSPLALKVRVFGPMNAPGVYAMTAMVLLLVLAGRRGLRAWRVAAMLLLATGLGLSLVRSAWIGVVVGMLTLFVIRGRGSRMRAALTAGAVLAVFVVAVQSGPVGALLSQRVSSLGNVRSDNSFQARVTLLVTVAPETVSSPLGYGIGSTGAAARASANAGSSGITDFDNGLLEIPFALGLLPGLLFLGALVRLTRRAMSSQARADPRIAALQAAWVAGLVQLFFVNALKGATGVFLCACLGLALAAAARAAEAHDAVEPDRAEAAAT